MIFEAPSILPLPVWVLSSLRFTTRTSILSYSACQKPTSAIPHWWQAALRLPQGGRSGGWSSGSPHTGPPHFPHHLLELFCPVPHQQSLQQQKERIVTDHETLRNYNMRNTITQHKGKKDKQTIQAISGHNFSLVRAHFSENFSPFTFCHHKWSCLFLDWKVW